MSEAAPRGTHTARPIAEARAALLGWIDEAGDGGRTFLQVRLLRTAPERYEARHAGDARRPLRSLRVCSDPFRAREIAGTTGAGEHRPLKTAPNLRRGWALAELDGHGLWTALEYLYPACAVHWYAERTGTLCPTPWRDTAGRQSGIYSPVGLLDDAAVRNAARACCADVVCLRSAAWPIAEDNPLEMPPEAGTGDATVPCPEACSLFVSFARKVVSLERAPRTPVPGLGTLNPAETEQLRELVAAAASGTLGRVREGEFGEPLNRRRLRYLAERLA